MIRAALLALAAGLAAPAFAQTAAAPAPAVEAALAPPALLAARTLRAGDVIDAGDLVLGDAPAPGALTDPAAAIGMEARVTLPKGRPIERGDLAAPALVDRNQIVSMTFTRGPLSIVTDGRALGRAALGERVRVMNLDSRATVTATVSGPGQVEIR